MIRDEKGVTLTVLVITIITMIILTGVVVNFGYDGMNEVRNNKLISQLSIVRQAIIEQYNQAVTLKKTQVPISEEPVSYWVGERIDDFSTIDLPAQSSIYMTTEAEEFYSKSTNYNCEYQEDYYYRLTPEKLTQIGIKDSKDTYIVNYNTGEVYNETKKMDRNSELLYLPSMKYNNSNNIEDKETFNDWTE